MALASILKPFLGKGRDTSEWEKAVLALLIAILLLGLLTIWQVRIFAPIFLFKGAVAIYVVLLALTIITWTRFLWSFLIDGLLGLALLAASISQPEHLTLLGTSILPTFIMIVGDILALLLGVTSLYVFWERFSPRILERAMEHRKVHADCASDAPCKTVPGYRV